MISEPFRTRMFRVLWQLSGRRQKIDRFLSDFLKYRKYLPECDAEEIIPGFSATEIRIRQCPLGTWSTPLVDVFVLLKAVLGFRSKRILELGSYRGETARLLAENTGDDVAIHAVDIDERHGAAYRGLPIAAKIVRKTGRISSEMFQAGEKYDLIFVDANHDFASVMNDTEVAFKVLEPGGVILWHDYAQDNYFAGLNGVAEALNCFSKKYPICAIRGTRLAIFVNQKNRNQPEPASPSSTVSTGTVWDETHMRG